MERNETKDETRPTPLPAPQGPAFLLVVGPYMAKMVHPAITPIAMR